MERFVLKKEHILLLKQAVVRWEDCEYGAPSIDCKRPYGTSSVEESIAEIIGDESDACPHCGESLDTESSENYKQLHKETETALSILLQHGNVPLGEYQKDGYSEWKPLSKEK